MAKRILLADNTESADKTKEVLEKALPNRFYSIEHTGNLREILEADPSKYHAVILNPEILPNNGGADKLAPIIDLARRNIPTILMLNKDLTRSGTFHTVKQDPNTIYTVGNLDNIHEYIKTIFQSNRRNLRRVAIVGMGNVGSSIAGELYKRVRLDDLVLYGGERKKEKIEAAIRDFKTSIPTENHGLEPIIAESLEEVRDESGIIVICVDSSKHRFGSEFQVDKRFDLLDCNYELICEIARINKNYSGNVLIVSNPVEPLTLTYNLAISSDPTNIMSIIEKSYRVQGVSYLEHSRALGILEEKYRELVELDPNAKVDVDCSVLGPHDHGVRIVNARFNNVAYDKFKGFTREVMDQLSEDISKEGKVKPATAESIKSAILEHIITVMENKYIARASTYIDIRRGIPNFNRFRINQIKQYRPIVTGIPGIYMGGMFNPDIPLSNVDAKAFIEINLAQQKRLLKATKKDPNKYQLFAEYFKVHKST